MSIRTFDSAMYRVGELERQLAECRAKTIEECAAAVKAFDTGTRARVFAEEIQSHVDAIRALGEKK